MLKANLNEYLAQLAATADGESETPSNRDACTITVCSTKSGARRPPWLGLDQAEQGLDLVAHGDSFLLLDPQYPTFKLFGFL